MAICNSIVYPRSFTRVHTKHTRTRTHATAVASAAFYACTRHVLCSNIKKKTAVRKIRLKRVPTRALRNDGRLINARASSFVVSRTHAYTCDNVYLPTAYTCTICDLPVFFFSFIFRVSVSIERTIGPPPFYLPYYLQCTRKTYYFLSCPPSDVTGVPVHA
jgi:hypothetical protein